MEGLYPFPAPCVLGHEAAGVVEAVGEDVTYVKPGDHVITCLSVFCGDCAQCMTGHPNLCENTEVKLRRRRAAAHLEGQAAEPVHQPLLLRREDAGARKRDGEGTRRRAAGSCALVGCGVITGVGAVFHAARVEPGATVAVIGCGGIGLSAMNGAASRGPGTSSRSSRAIEARCGQQMGATDTSTPRTPSGGKDARDDRRRCPVFV